MVKEEDTDNKQKSSLTKPTDQEMDMYQVCNFRVLLFIHVMYQKFIYDPVADYYNYF